MRPAPRRPRRGPGRGLVRLLILAMLLAGLYIGLDVVASSVAENQLAQAIRSRTSAAKVTVQVNRPLFLFDLLARSQVQSVDVQLTDVSVRGLVLARVEVAAQNLRIDRAVLFSGHRVRLTGISSAGASATVTAAELSQAIGHRVVLDGARGVKVGIGSLMTPARIAIARNDLLTMQAGGRQVLRVNLATSPLFRRCPLHLAVGQGSATLSCHVAPVPPTVVAALSTNG
ncbi:MAG: LmeA family phospholipid-binding protein [Acidimicrobiales bacterium]